MTQTNRAIIVPLFCGLCFLLHLFSSPFLRLPFPIGAEDFFIADLLQTTFPLRVDTLHEGHLWTVLSYALVHGNWWHLLFNLFGLWITGRTLEQILGWKRISALFLLGCLAGAVGFLISLILDPRLAPSTTCIGASAILTASIGTITTTFAQQPVTLWIGFIPIRLKAILLLPLLLICFIIECALPSLGTAYGAHLGGWLAGLFFGLAIRKDCV